MIIFGKSSPGALTLLVTISRGRSPGPVAGPRELNASCANESLLGRLAGRVGSHAMRQPPVALAQLMHSARVYGE